MECDEVYYRRMCKLSEEIISYINEVYLKEIDENLQIKIISLLEAWDRDNKMLDEIVASIAIGGKFCVSRINKNVLDKNISRIIFREYINTLIKNVDINSLNILKKFEIDEIRLRVLIKDYLEDNIRDMFNREIEDISVLNFYLYEKEGNLKIVEIKLKCLK